MGTKHQLSSVGTLEIKIGEDCIKSVSCARNLSFWMDSDLKNKTHINKLVSTLYQSLKGIAKIRQLVDKETCQTMIQALITSRLDYCNSLLLGSTEVLIDKLQKVQNMACCIVVGKRKYDHISEDMKSLHWLRIHQRIVYKIAIMVFQCLKGNAPQYLKDLLVVNHGCPLHSHSMNKLPVVRANTSLAWKSSFNIAGPSIWNNLPDNLHNIQSLHNFKNKLKTYLFCKSYDTHH